MAGLRGKDGVLGECNTPDKTGPPAPRNRAANRLCCVLTYRGTNMLSAPATILSAAVTILAVLVIV
ncbi:MAG TPA: hypothetical protein VGC16_05220, partial [Rhizomicrobium sp.]